MIDNKNIGKKDDDNKLRWDLIPWSAVAEIVRVLMFGSRKYADNNWKFVDNAQNRYFAAAMRHLTAWYEGESVDPETGLNHLSHAGCCILFLIWGVKNLKEINR